MGNVSKLFADRLSDLVEDCKKERNIKHNQIAKTLAISTGALSKYMSDGAVANIEAVEAIARYFNVPTDYLLGLTDSEVYENIDVNNLLGLSDGSIEILKRLYADSKQERPAPNFNDVDSSEYLRTINAMLSLGYFFEVIEGMVKYKEHMNHAAIMLEEIISNDDAVEKSQTANELFRSARFMLFEIQESLRKLVEKYAEAEVKRYNDAEDNFKERWLSWQRQQKEVIPIKSPAPVVMTSTGSKSAST